MGWRRDEDEDDEDDFDEEPDYGDNDEAETVACPNCREQIVEDAERCPHCGHYVTDEELRKAGKPWWLYLGVAVCLYLIVRGFIGW